MAATSSTATHYPYDIFINHRGPDVKKTFASHLYHGLSKQGLRVFLDQPELQPGDHFPSQIEDAVRTASIHVAVFSPRYAESTWCLRELCLMLESEKTIIPVFYNVTPAELRWTRGKAGNYAQALQKLARGCAPGKAGKYGEALRKLAKKKTYDHQIRKWKLRYDSATIENWRNALSRVANISGFELDMFNGDEGELVENVVRYVLKKVENDPLYVAKYPSGLEDKVKDFENEVLVQQQQSGKPPILGIVGLGGVGKTTLAMELFSRKRSHYNKCCFLSEVRDKAGKGNLILLQRKFLKELTGSDEQNDEMMQTLLKKHLSSTQIFVVLDDVDDVDQVDALLPDQTAVRSDSLILITSRYKNILTSSGVENSFIYKLTGLNEQHSQELFCSHAFRQPYPLPGFESVVNKFLDACQGLPLSLRVFGALVCGKSDQSYWEDQLEKLGRTLPYEIKKKLQISFEALDREEREIFLDIACFFIGEDRDMAVRIWDGSHWKCFQNLEERCLVEVDSKNVIHMHDHLRDLGREIGKAPGLVRGTENIDDLLQPSPNEQVITEVRGIWVQGNKHANGLAEIRWHRGILHLPASEDDLLERILTRVHTPNLLWLRWDNCRHSSLPSWIPVNNLRVLEMRRGDVEMSLWEGEWQAPLQLRDLQIGCVLRNIPDSVGQLKHLERIWQPAHFFQYHQISSLPEEFSHLESLKTLILKGCSELKSLPDTFGNLRNLQYIDLSRSSSLERLPETFRNLIKLKYLNLRFCSKLAMSSETLGTISTLEHINLNGCKKIEVLPFQVANQRWLEELHLKHTNLKELPNAIGKLSELEALYVGSPLLATLPPSLGDLRNLKTLELDGCKELKCLPASVGQLTQLTSMRVRGCPISELPSLGDLRNLTEMSVSGCPISELPSLGDLRNLKTLELDGCKELKCLPASVGQLTQLTEMRVKGCPVSELSWLGNVSNLKTLALRDCKELKCLPASLGMLTQLTEMIVHSCPISELPSLGDLRNLKTLELDGCEELKCLPASVGQLTQLTRMRVKGCPVSELPWLGNSSNLKTLALKDCKELKCLPASLGMLTQLTEMSVDICLISDLTSPGNLLNLKTLSDLTSSGNLLNLKTLRLYGGCSELEELSGVEHLRSLGALTLDECVKLKNVRGLAQCTKLHMLRLYNCPELEDLEGVEHCTSLRVLRSRGCPKLWWGEGVMEQLQQRVEVEFNWPYF